MKLIFAQGNPGTAYELTRHNVGFMVLDLLAQREQAQWKHEAKFKADIATIQLSGEKILLVKPHSFYNETGLVARALVDFYKLTPASDVLVIHDELALPFGTVRIRDKGSDAGNNGIKSLNTHLGTQYMRIRIGIWNEQRERMDDASFVLSRFTADESQQLHAAIQDTVLTLIDNFASGTLEPASHSI